MTNHPVISNASKKNRTSFIKIALLGSAALSFSVPAAFAQESAAEDAEAINKLDTIVVTGSRATIQNTIDLKRTNSSIVDGLSAKDIGDLPALSIGEALESITGAASHRENGGATEISIRGLGPFLSATTFNGRVATNGTGDRSVNFSQFPSELMNKLAIYKTQDASLIEGGVAGLIALETLKPLDYNQRRVQFNLTGNYNPDQQNIDNTMAGDLGYRGTLSYVDQFELGGLGQLGFSIGGQRSDISQPEQEMRSSSPSGTSLFACIADATDPDSRGYAASSSGDCEDQGPNSSNNDGYNTTIDPETGLAVDDGLDYAWAGSSRGYRQNDTHDTRDSLFTALQWQPNDRLDINADLQWSERVQNEDRHDLNFSNMKRSVAGDTLDSLIFQDNGVVQSITTQSDIESNGEIYERTEEYLGYGLSGSFDVTDKLTISADYSFSETTRDELQASIRVSSQGGPGSGGRENLSWARDGDGFVNYTVQDFDVTDISNYTDGVRLRVDRDAERRNTVEAIRFDAEYDLGMGPITSVETGFRLSDLEYVSYAATRDEYNASDFDSSSVPCETGFAESGFLSSASDALVTQIDSDGNVVSTTNTWAVFDNQCLVDYILAENGETSLVYPDSDPDSLDNTNVLETTLAGYVMANYDTSLAGKPFSGNFGLRVVDTKVKSLGNRTPVAVITNPVDGTLSLETDGDAVVLFGKGEYTEFLPSFNGTLELRDDILLRAGLFRGMSRADPGNMTFGRDFNENNEEDAPTTIEELISVEGSGNPNFQPLMSWNYDIAAEWYPNDDSILAASIYYKNFTGGFENSTVLEDFIIDGATVTLPVSVTATNEDTAALYGIELTASHNFSYLPGLFSGFGAKVSLNLAESDFEFEDSLYGDLGYRDADGNLIQTNVGILQPGNVPGFSDVVASGQIYYQKGKFDSSLIYKYRSEYFQPYTSNGTRLRYVGDVGVWEARASYDLTENLSLTVSGINLFNAPKEQYFFTNDNLGEVNYYGPRVFFGIKGKF